MSPVDSAQTVSGALNVIFLNPQVDHCTWKIACGMMNQPALLAKKNMGMPTMIEKVVFVMGIERI